MENNEYIIWGFAVKDEKDPGVIGASTKLHNFLVEEGLWDQVLFCVDSNPLRQGVNLFGKMTYFPDKIKEYPQATVIVNVQAQKAIIKAADEMGIKNELLFTSCHYYHNYISGEYPAGTNAGRDFYQYMKDVEKQVRDMYDTSDKITSNKIDTMYKVVEKTGGGLFTAEFYGDTAVGHDYFCDESLAPEGDVTLVDVGAFIGDSIEPVRKFYGERFKKCYAFEPDSLTLEKLKKYLNDSGLNDTVQVYNCALGVKEGTVSFNQNGITSVVEENGDTTITVKRFDDIYDGHVGTLMIKMDIEGEELNALKGMENVIKTYKPYLAICVYHKLGDILEIPEYLKSLNSEYKFYLRGGWHLECWAVPRTEE